MNERKVDLFVKAGQSRLIDFCLQCGCKPASDVGGFSQFACEVQIEAAQRYVRKAVRRVRRIEEVRIEHRIVPYAFDLELRSCVMA